MAEEAKADKVIFHPNFRTFKFESSIALYNPYIDSLLINDLPEYNEVIEDLYGFIFSHEKYHYYFNQSISKLVQREIVYSSYYFLWKTFIGDNLSSSIRALNYLRANAINNHVGSAFTEEFFAHIFNIIDTKTPFHAELCQKEHLSLQSTYPNSFNYVWDVFFTLAKNRNDLLSMAIKFYPIVFNMPFCFEYDKNLSTLALRHINADYGDPKLNKWFSFVLQKFIDHFNITNDVPKAFVELYKDNNIKNIFYKETTYKELFLPVIEYISDCFSNSFPLKNLILKLLQKFLPQSYQSTDYVFPEIKEDYSCYVFHYPIEYKHTSLDDTQYFYLFLYDSIIQTNNIFICPLKTTTCTRSTCNYFTEISSFINMLSHRGIPISWPKKECLSLTL